MPNPGRRSRLKDENFLPDDRFAGRIIELEAPAARRFRDAQDQGGLRIVTDSADLSGPGDDPPGDRRQSRGRLNRYRGAGAVLQRVTGQRGDRVVLRAAPVAFRRGMDIDDLVLRGRRAAASSSSRRTTEAAESRRSGNNPSALSSYSRSRRLRQMQIELHRGQRVRLTDSLMMNE